jgi:hypothetical protein
MKCPICDLPTNFHDEYYLEKRWCPHCEVWQEDTPLLRNYYSSGLNKRFDTYVCFCAFTDHLIGDAAVVSAVQEMRKVIRHSEWHQWWYGIRVDSATSFLQSLFADWCADNGFHLQEQAVRERLSSG